MTTCPTCPRPTPLDPTNGPMTCCQTCGDPAGVGHDQSCDDREVLRGMEVGE